MRSWIPWRYLVRRWAKARGFLDPVLLLAHVSKFSQKSEVLAPLELLRTGVLLQARGLINSQAIQHNLDWVWPYWVVRQFDPKDNSFVPRAFDFTHINITHRNWTAVGLPDFGELPIVDPRGLVTPFLDGWSVDAWVVDERGHELIPSRLLEAGQSLAFHEAADKLSVETLMERHLLYGAFFHDISHSGINIYLTLHVAQALLRAGDARFFDVMKAVAGMASPTGQWPVAIHPRTGGGCMGDGQHVWASAEWVQIIRDSFVREESDPDRLVLCSGLAPDWFDAGSELESGPCMTDDGPVSVAVRKEAGRAIVSWKARWRGRAPAIDIRLPGFVATHVKPGEESSAVVTAEALWTST